MSLWLQPSVSRFSGVERPYPIKIWRVLRMILERSTGLIHPASFIASPNCDPRPAATGIDLLVVHCISLPPGEYVGRYIERFFCNELDPAGHAYFGEICELKVSAHFLVRRSGDLIQFVPTHLRAWHAGQSRYGDRDKVNDFSIGIELEGTEETPFTDAQYDTLIDLSITLISAYPEIDSSSVVGHSDIAPGRKTDPGVCFDWKRFRNGLAPAVD